MGATNVRERLRQACEALEAAREASGPTESEEWLSGVRTQLRHFVDGDTTDPEAHVYPSPGAIETIQERLDGVIDRTEEEAVAAHLEDARESIRQVRQMLDDRLRARPESTAEER